MKKILFISIGILSIIILVLISLKLSDSLMPDFENIDSDFRKITRGMTRKEVLSIVGKPHNEFRISKGVEEETKYRLIWKYNGKRGAWSEYIIILNHINLVVDIKYEVVGPFVWAIKSKVKSAPLI